MCEKVKIVDFFGDSIGRGVVMNHDSGKYGFTQESFANLVCEKFNLAINNFSKFGCTVTKGLGIVKKKLPENNCDFAVVEYGGNDSDFKWPEIAANPKGEHLPNTPLEEFGKNYEEIIDTIRASGKLPVIMNLPPIDAQRYFNWFSRGINGDNVLEWLNGDTQCIYRYHEMYNMRVCTIAARKNVLLIDIRSALLAKFDYRDYICDDGIHLNEKGHLLVADTIETIIDRRQDLLA